MEVKEAFAFDFESAERPGVRAATQMVAGFRGDADGAWLGSSFQSRRQVYGISPYIVLVFAVADDASDYRTDVDADADLPE